MRLQAINSVLERNPSAFDAKFKTQEVSFSQSHGCFFLNNMLSRGQVGFWPLDVLTHHTVYPKHPLYISSLQLLAFASCVLCCRP